MHFGIEPKIIKGIFKYLLSIFTKKSFGRFFTKNFPISQKDENPYLDIDTESGTILIKNSNQFDYEEKFNDLPIQIKAHVSDGGKIGKF